MKVFVVDGNIGSGKSTFLRMLQDRYENNKAGLYTVEIIQEPVDEWMKIRNEENVSLFELYYKNPKQYAYLFQTNILASRFNKIKLLMEKCNKNPELCENTIVICERSIMTDMFIFVEAALSMEHITKVEYEVFVSLYEMFMQLSNFRVDGVVYIRCDPSVSMRRISQRNRKGEEDMDAAYIKLLHEKHENWLIHPDHRASMRVLTIENGDCNDIADHINKLEEFIF
jgi:deoxyadenosine/deoxycytidine kinase